MPDIAEAEEAQPLPVQVVDAAMKGAEVPFSEPKESKEDEAEVAVAEAPPASLTVDTAAAEEEDEEAISATDVQSAQPAGGANGASPAAEKAAPEMTPVPPAYGAEHGWCPLCIAQRRQQQQEAEQRPREGEDDNDDDDEADALSLSWPEQALFACGADHLDAIVRSQSAFFPPAGSLPPFAPVAVCVIGPPLTGRTTLALKLASALQLSYVSLPAMLASHFSRSPELVASCAAELELPVELLLDALCTELLQTARQGGSRGWVLDGWPRTREEAEMLEQRGMLVRQAIVLGLQAGQRVEGDRAVADAVDRRWKEKRESEERRSSRQQGLETARLAALALLAERRRVEEEQQAHLTCESAGDTEAEEAEETQGESTEAAVAGEDEGAAGSVQHLQDSSVTDSDASPAAAVTAADDEFATAALVIVQLTVQAEGEVAIAVNPAHVQPPVQDASGMDAPVAADPLQALLSSLSASLSGQQWSERAAAFDSLLSFLSSRRLLAFMPGPPSINAALPDALQLLSRLSSARMAHFAAVAACLPSSLSSLPFPQSLLLTHQTSFGDYCCVCFHEGRGLRDMSSSAAAASSRIVQCQRGLLRVCNEQEEQQLLQDAPRYCDASSFPTDFPVHYTQDDEQDGLPLQYDGCCPVSVANWQAGQTQFVQRGREDSTALYQRRLFRCASAASLADFMSFPDRYSSLSVSSPLPLEPQLPSALSLLQSGQTLPFLHAAFMAPLSAALSQVAEHRHQLLYPSLSVRRTACLLLSLCLRSDQAAVQRFLQDCSVVRRVKAEMDRGEAEEGRDDGLLQRYDQLSTVMADGEWQSLRRRFLQPQ